MQAEPNFDETVHATLMQLGRRPEQASDQTLATLRPRERDRTKTELEILMHEVRPTASGLERIELHGKLGEGGMGVVRLGTQRALGREVAIKSTRGDTLDPPKAVHLLREAWLTGALEHPNVVPVYDIAVDGGGGPLVVLKKIEGDDWGSLIDDASTVRERFGAEDLLEWNLRILMQVCNAIRFAHSRRIVHRDIKPQNVRIGTFGEVYLLDWGVAASLDDDGTGRLPTVDDAEGIVGTPAYLAPEMLGGGHVDTRTDIYLLGAVLHQIANGRAPHAAPTWYEVVASVLRSAPAFAEDVPTELRTIVERAMAKEPGDRYPSVEALRLAIADFLQHRDAARLAHKASERLGELLELLATTPLEGDEATHRERCYRLFSECRFGLRNALESWPENLRAREDQVRAVVAMAEYELAHDNPGAARTLLGDLDEAPPELAQRIAEAEQLYAREEAALLELKAQHDPNSGRTVRAVISIAMALVFIVAPSVSMVMHFINGQPVSVEFGLTMVVGICFVFGGFAYWARDTLRSSRINLQLAGAAGFALVATALAHVATMLGGYDLWEPLHASHLVWAVLAGSVALVIDKRLLVASATYAVAYIVLAIVGRDHVLESIVFTNLVLALNVAHLWARPKARDGRATAA